MKSLSIKAKLMFWYAFVMIIIVSLSMLMLLFTGDKLARDGAKSSLSVTTDRALKDIRIVDNKLNIDDDMMYYSDGSYVVIYKDDGVPLSGLELEAFPKNVKFVEDEIREIEDNGKTFYVYDRLIENKNVGKIWVRGMASADLEVISPTIVRLISIFEIALPVILILALIGGYVVSSRAFAPLKEINKTAQKIHDGRDISLRIAIGDNPTGDEIVETARLFNEMLDSVEKSFESEKRFTDDASHELRTPTSVVLTQSEYALDNIDNKQEVRQSLEIILRQAHKMTDLLNNLLMLARADHGRIEMGKEIVDLGLVVELVAAAHEPDARRKNISIATGIIDEVQLTGDMSLIESAVGNLVSNAIKYGKENGHVLLRLSTAEGAWAKIEVADDGIGMSADQIGKVWDRFYRADGAGDHNSMGLGLPLTKWIVESHGGKINVESRQGDGSIFTVLLPIA